MYKTHFSEVLNQPLDLESSNNLHRVDRGSFEPSILIHVLDVNSSLGRYVLRNISISLFFLIIFTLFGLTISNLVIILDRADGIIHKENVALHFAANICFIATEVICYMLADIFFAHPSDTPRRLPENEREPEQIFRGYMVVNMCCLLSYLSYLVLVQQTFYWQAYWAIFCSAVFFMYAHIRVTMCMQELTDYAPLKVQRFEKFSRYFYFFGLTAFVGFVCLVIDSLVLANQTPEFE